MKLGFSTLMGLLVVCGWAQAATYNLDSSHTRVEFSVKHLMVTTVKGHFNKYDGKFDFDPAKKELKNIEVSIDTASVDTQNEDRDKHLRNDDFFNAEEYPKISFKSDKAVKVNEGKSVKVPGQLTIRDQTKPVVLDVTYNGAAEFMGKKKVGFLATTKIDRKDFGVKWNKALDKGGLAVSDSVNITIDGEADMVEAQPAAK